MPEVVSFVIPFLNERECLPQLLERLGRLELGECTQREYILVDDGSTDGGTQIVEASACVDPSVKLIVLSRNFGHQAAVCAGLANARGDFICIMDADLQDPPEVILDMLAEARRGADVVYAVRKERQASFVMRVCYKLYYRMLRALADTEIPVDSGDFCVINRRVAAVLRGLPETQRFVRGLRSWVGFKQVGWEYTRPERAAGVPKYTLKRLLKLGFDGIFSFSTKPLRFATFAGACLALFCLAYTGYAILWRIFSGQQLPGFATLAVGIFFLGAVQLISIGLLGEYLGRIYLEVKRRPTYVVDRDVNIGSHG